MELFWHIAIIAGAVYLLVATVVWVLCNWAWSDLFGNMFSGPEEWGLKIVGIVLLETFAVAAGLFWPSSLLLLKEYYEA